MAVTIERAAHRRSWSRLPYATSCVVSDVFQLREELVWQEL
jgi:hypothetical protein